MSEQQPQERRRFYRIDEAVGLSVEELTPEQSEARRKDVGEVPTGTLIGELHMERESLLPVMRELETTHPAIARYLKLLERQVDLLARAIGDPDDNLPDTPTHTVNLSAQGVRFHHGGEIDQGQPVSVNLKLFPSRLRLELLGEVVACKPVSDGEFDIAVDFRYITPADQELLIKHIHARQLGSLGSEDRA